MLLIVSQAFFFQTLLNRNDEYTISLIPVSPVTARPEVNCRPLVVSKDGDKVLILATDGVWERASGEDVLRWTRNFYEERIAEAERLDNRKSNNSEKVAVGEEQVSVRVPVAPYDGMQSTDRGNDSKKRELANPSSSPTGKRRKRTNQKSRDNIAEVIVRRVLNKVRRTRNISSLHALMSLPPGRARRSKHDDITACVVDLSAFIS
jgi:hypothetical protein